MSVKVINTHQTPLSAALKIIIHITTNPAKTEVILGDQHMFINCMSGDLSTVYVT